MKTAKERLLDAIAPDVDGVFVSSELNIFYLTNFDYTDGFVLVTRNKSYVITDFRYAEAAKAAVSDEFEIVVPQSRMLIEIASLLEENGVKKLMFEDGFVSCADHARFAELFKSCELVSGGTDALSALREVKTEAELEKINAAQKITDAAFAHILNFIKPEMTELEVALELEFFMRRMGAQSTAFDTIAVSGASSSLPHGVPQARKLEKGFFTMDFGARLDGYCSDMTRTVVLGRADEDMKKLYNKLRNHPRAVVIMTEKDAVRLRSARLPEQLMRAMYYQPISLSFVEGPDHDFAGRLLEEIRYEDKRQVADDDESKADSKVNL